MWLRTSNRLNTGPLGAGWLAALDACAVAEKNVVIVQFYHVWLLTILLGDEDRWPRQHRS